VRNVGVRIIPYSGPIMQPRSIPRDIPAGPDTTVAASPDAPDLGPGGYVGAGGTNLPEAISGRQPVIPSRPKQIDKIFRRSEMLQGMLIRKVEPKYPPLAMQARIQGPVVLAAVISKAGTIDNLRLISGHPLLVQAAIDAVSQWRYRPYVLNDELIEVDTQITVNFVLGER